MRIDYEKYLNKNKFYTKSQIRKLFPSLSPFLTNSLVLKDGRDFISYKFDNNLISLNEQHDNVISEKLLIELLSDNGMWNYLRTRFKYDYPVAFTISYINDTNEVSKITVTKSEFVYALKQIEDKITNKERLYEIYGKTSPDFLMFLYSNDNPDEDYSNKHSCVIDGVETTVEVNELLRILTLDDRRFEYFKSGNYLSIHNVDVLTYMLVDFCEKNKIFKKFYFEPNIVKRYHELKNYKLIDYESVNKYNKSGLEDQFGRSIVNDYDIDTELKEDIFNNQEDDYSELEEALYAYIKLCDYLTIDDNYYFNNENKESSNIIMDSIYKVGTITKENNKINALEFVLIYAKLLSELGIKYNINHDSLTNPNISFKSGEFLVNVDLFKNTIKNDMSLVKIGRPLRGIRILNKNIVTHMKFNETMKRVYFDYVINNKKQKEYHDAVNIYKAIDSIGVDMDTYKQVRVVLSLIKNTKLYGIDLLNYIQEVLHNTIESNEEISYKLYLYKQPDTTNIRLYIAILINDDIFMIDLNGDRNVSMINKETLDNMETNDSFKLLSQYNYNDIVANKYKK